MLETTRSLRPLRALRWMETPLCGRYLHVGVSLYDSVFSSARLVANIASFVIAPAAAAAAAVVRRDVAVLLYQVGPVQTSVHALQANYRRTRNEPIISV